jgi:cytochrome c peroxidase
MKTFLAKRKNLFSCLRFFALPLLGLLLLNSCSKKTSNSSQLFWLAALLNKSSGYDWDLPPGFPEPNVPKENPMTKEKVTLGRFLFYDTKLSQNQTQSCSSCHLQSLAFSDGRAVAMGSTGQTHPRNAQQLSNVAYHPVLTWSNPTQITLEVQSTTPLFGTAPLELGLSGTAYLDRFKTSSLYRELFADAFGGGLSKINEQNIRFALASFQRTLISGYSPFDKFSFQNQRNALSASAKNGLEIFNGEVAECFHCHGGFNFTDTATHSGIKSDVIIYNDNGHRSKSAYIALNDDAKMGLYEITGRATDIGKFRAPSLRNVALTYPYFHDGSVTCTNPPSPGVYDEACAREALGRVVNHYMTADSIANNDSNRDGSLIRSFSLTNTEKEQLIEFLLSLTDQEFINNKKFSNPFP